MKTRNSHGLLQLGREALAYCQCASALISGNKALFVSVDLIGEKNQVILEFLIMVTVIITSSLTFTLLLEYCRKTKHLALMGQTFYWGEKRTKHAWKNIRYGCTRKQVHLCNYTWILRTFFISTRTLKVQVRGAANKHLVLYYSISILRSSQFNKDKNLFSKSIKKESKCKVNTR